MKIEVYTNTFIYSKRLIILSIFLKHSRHHIAIHKRHDMNDLDVNWLGGLCGSLGMKISEKHCREISLAE